METKHLTPWQRVAERFALSQAELAREIGCDRSKISRVLSDPSGLINGADQRKLMEAAARRRVKLAPADLLPEVRR